MEERSYRCGRPAAVHLTVQLTAQLTVDEVHLWEGFRPLRPLPRVAGSTRRPRKSSPILKVVLDRSLPNGTAGTARFREAKVDATFDANFVAGFETRSVRFSGLDAVNSVALQTYLDLLLAQGHSVDQIQAGVFVWLRVAIVGCLEDSLVFRTGKCEQVDSRLIRYPWPYLVRFRFCLARLLSSIRGGNLLGSVLAEWFRKAYPPEDEPSEDSVTSG